MNISRPRRGRDGSKRLDLTDIKRVLADDRRWVAIGLIVANVDGSLWWRVENDDQGNPVDILVDTVLQPSQIPLTARMESGVWVVPRLGEEVVISIPDGKVDFMPTIIGILSSNEVPATQGPTPDRMVLARSEIVAHDGTGGAVPLAPASDLTTLLNAIGSAAVVAGDGGASFKAAILASLSAWPNPTTVFKAK